MKTKIVMQEFCTLLDIVGVCTHLIPEDRVQYEAFTGRPYEIDAAAVGHWHFAGPKFTAFVDDRPIVVGGYVPVRPGVYNSWFLSTPEAWRTPGVTTITRQIIAGMLQNGAHRLETVCLASRADTRRWYEKIGLRFETTLEKYGARGEDAACHIATREVSS